METFINNSVLKDIEELKYDFENGSSVIAKKAIDIFIEYISLTDFEQSDEKILQVKEQIVNIKPAMSAIRNVLEYAYLLNKNGNHPQEIRNQLLETMKFASENIIEQVTQHITDNGFYSIATCSYSSTVLNLLNKLKSLNDKFNVIVLESKWDGKDYSKKVLEECKTLKIEVQILSPGELIVSEFDCSIIGADSVIPGKGIVNGIPSLLFSESIKDRVKPLFVIAESFKITEISMIKTNIFPH